jgi:hypothetical protein
MEKMEIQMNSDEYLKKAFESTIGINPKTGNQARPSSGFVISRSQLEQKRKKAKENGWNDGKDAIYELEDSDEFGDGLTAYGDIQIILKPEVAKRTSYMRGDPISSGGRPVLMGSDNTEDILDALLNADGKNKKSHMADAVINLLNARVKREKNESISTSRKLKKGETSTEKSNSVMHAQILGGYTLADIEGIYYPFSKVQKYSLNTDVSDVMKNAISIDEIINQRIPRDEAVKLHEKIGMGSIDTPGVAALRDYRMAMKIRKQYVDAGIRYVMFSHKEGKNIDNPKSYDPSAKPNEKVEDVLKRIIISEVRSGIKKFHAQMIKAEGGK